MYTIERLSSNPAIYIKLHENFIVPDGIVAYYSKVENMLEHEDELLPVIIDIDLFKMSFDDLLKVTKLGIDKKSNIAKNPRISRIILISNNGLLKFSMDRMQKIGLGDNSILVSSLEEALL